MEFNSIGVAITDKCNAACSMCCSSCESELRELQRTMTDSDISLILSQIKKCTSISRIGITGGEPMLFPELVQGMIDFDFERPVSFSIKTNGFWGSQRKRARAFIEKNKDKIECLSFSYDEFHKEHISLDSIKSLLDLAWEYRIPTEVVGCFKKDSYSPGNALDDLGEFAYKTTFKYQPVFKTGRANDLPESSFFDLYDSSFDDLPCLALRNNSPLITAELDLYPCCSQVIQNTILKVGNLRERTLERCLEDMVHNKLLVELFTKGLSPFLKEASREYEVPRYISCPCEACEFLFSTAERLRRVSHALSSGNR